MVPSDLVAIADQHTGLAMSGRACLKLSRSAVLSKELSDLSPPSRFQFFHGFTDPPSQDGNCEPCQPRDGKDGRTGVTGQEAPNQYCEGNPAIRQLLLGQQLGTGQSCLERSVPTRPACVHRCANTRISIDANKPYRSVRGYQYYLTGSRCPPEMPGAKVQLILLDLRHD